jgi:hypothetical protein
VLYTKAPEAVTLATKASVEPSREVCTAFSNGKSAELVTPVT